MNESFVDIGLRISAQMEKLKLKQKDLCEDTEISKNAISNYVNGNRIPDTNSIYKLSKALNVSMEWLLTGSDSNITTNENFVENETLEEDEQELLDGYRELNDRDKREVLAYINMKKDLQKKNIKAKSSTSRNGKGKTGEEAATSETA